MSATAAARQDYLSEFSSEREAIQFAELVLNSGREFLPSCVHSVLDGGEPTAEYWNFLTNQILEERQEVV